MKLTLQKLTLTNFMGHTDNPNKPTIKAIADALSVSVNELKDVEL
jgi:hypothetical protein